MSLKLYHNPNCSKSRQGKKILEDNNIEFETKLYMKEPISYSEITKIVNLFPENPMLLIRTKEKLFKELNIDTQTLNDKKEIIKLIQKYPKLMERPLLNSENFTIIGRPPENFKLILN